MDEFLREINRSLRALDEAHRLGEITRSDYRARRRELLSGWGNGAMQAGRRTGVVSNAAGETAPGIRGRGSRWFAWLQRLVRRD
ncbi:MAG TPA: hypothetical protein VFY97_11160 [Rhodanobacteraceae bacterium]|nr:hypothetical protein [Rhodanobacteraceae bacterium]